MSFFFEICQFYVPHSCQLLVKISFSGPQCVSTVHISFKKDNSLQSLVDYYHYWLMNIWIWIIDYDFNLAFFLQMNNNVCYHYVQHRHTLFISMAGEDWRRNPGTTALTVQHKAYLGSRWIKNFPVDQMPRRTRDLLNQLDSNSTNSSTYLPSTAE